MSLRIDFQVFHLRSYIQIMNGNYSFKSHYKTFARESYNEF